MIVFELKKKVAEALNTLGVAAPEVTLEHPADLAHGDYATNVALVYAKALKANPRKLAEKLVGELQNIEYRIQNIDKIEVAGAGFINFYLSPKFFAQSVGEIIQTGVGFGKNEKRKGQKVMVEYTDPNPFKEFHIGHLMANAIGESIARLVEAEGAVVKRACWQGDVGLHVAKAVWGAQKLKVKSEKLKVEEWGDAYAKGSEAYETDEAAKVEINALNKKIFERSDEEVNKLYDAGREVSLLHFEGLYKILGTKFDYYFFEGTEGREGVPIVEEYLKKGVFERSGGAVVFHGEKVGLHTRVFLTKEGLPTYEAKELGLNRAKFQKEPDLTESLIVTANEQSDYFKVVLAAMREIFPDIARKTRHIAHGLLRFTSGKMSSRKGNVITGETLLEQVQEMVYEKIKEREFGEEEKKRVAEAITVGAIKYSILRQAMGGDIIFDFEKSISFEGDSGPYLQYSYVRAKSVLEKAKSVLSVVNVESVVDVVDDGTVKNVVNVIDDEDARRTKHVHPVQHLQQVQHLQPSPLERLLYRFPEVVERAAEECAPHHIVTYLAELAGAFNGWYAKEKIIGSGEEEPYRLALTQAFAAVIKNGLWLLGIAAPEKM